MTLSLMKVFYAIVNIHREHLLPEKAGEVLDIHLPDNSGRKRSSHLRIHAVNSDRSIVIRQYDNDVAAGGDGLPVMLEHLLANGPEMAAEFVGTRLLAELKDLHPLVFAPFGQLTR